MLRIRAILFSRLSDFFFSLCFLLQKKGNIMYDARNDE